MEKRAIGYVRRSKESGARTVSLEEQTEQIRAYCEKHGWILVQILSDDGVSGGRRDRLVRLESLVKSTKAKAVVVYNLDRFARDVSAALDKIRAFTKRGIELHVVQKGGPVEVETANGLLITGVESLMAEHYRRVISEKTKDALQRLKAKGRRISGIIPYGYRLSDDGISLEADSEEQMTLSAIRELRSTVTSLRELSAELADRGLLARSGRPFSSASLWRIVGPIEAGTRIAIRSKRRGKPQTSVQHSLFR